MQHPEYLYWTLVAVLGVPSALFNRVAAIIVIVRVLNQAAYNAGLNEALAQSVIYGAAILPAMRYSRTTPCYTAGVLFIGLFTAAFLNWHGVLDDTSRYWLVYAFAIAQILTVPLGNDWQAIGAFVARARDDWRRGVSLRFAPA